MAIKANGVTTLLEVFDMPQSVTFYRDVLGFEVIQQWDPGGHLSWAILRLGGAVVMLNERYEPEERPLHPDSQRAEAHDDTELYFDCPDVDEAYAHLLKKGLSVASPEITHYGMKQVWVTDPDGFRLCFHQPAE
jgi:glyoxylase I family protein